MQSSPWTLVTAEIEKSRITKRKLLLVGGLLVGALSLHAQSVVSAPPALVEVPTALAKPSTSDSALPTILGSSPFEWGPVTAYPHLIYRFLYGNGIQSTPGQQSDTSIQTISLGVLLKVGTHWTVDYTPTQTYYSDPAFKDTLDHSVLIQGGTIFEDWTLNFSQSYVDSSQPLIETGRQTEEEDFATTASAVYHLNRRTQLDTTASYQARFTTGFPDSKESTVGERLHYQFFPGIDTSASFDYGYVNMSVGSDMSYIRPGAQLELKPTDKLTFSARAGVEIRKFRTGGTDDLHSPTFGASMQYLPFVTTTLSFSVDHGVGITYFTNEVNKNTSWTVGLQQRLLQHYYLSASYSGQKSTYLSTSPSVAGGRDDQSNSFNIRLSTAIFQRVTVAVLYQNTHNASNSVGFGFTSSQVGFELGYRF